MKGIRRLIVRTVVSTVVQQSPIIIRTVAGRVRQWRERKRGVADADPHRCPTCGQRIDPSDRGRSRSS